jgi:hypothetical protein
MAAEFVPLVDTKRAQQPNSCFTVSKTQRFLPMMPDKDFSTGENRN